MPVTSFLIYYKDVVRCNFNMKIGPKMASNNRQILIFMFSHFFSVILFLYKYWPTLT